MRQESLRRHGRRVATSPAARALHIAPVPREKVVNCTSSPTARNAPVSIAWFQNQNKINGGCMRQKIEVLRTRPHLVPWAVEVLWNSANSDCSHGRRHCCVVFSDDLRVCRTMYTVTRHVHQRACSPRKPAKRGPSRRRPPKRHRRYIDTYTLTLSRPVHDTSKDRE